MFWNQKFSSDIFVNMLENIIQHLTVQPLTDHVDDEPQLVEFAFTSNCIMLRFITHSKPYTGLVKTSKETEWLQRNTKIGFMLLDFFMIQHQVSHLRV